MPDIMLPDPPDLPRFEMRRGRGAVSNPPPRFESQHATRFDDGWDTLVADLADLPPLPTTLIRDASRSALSFNTSPDLGFDRSINPYRGCEHGCVYCFARPSHAWLGYSPGLDFETKLVYKPDIVELLERALRRPGYQPQPIALGTNTDPYQPVERTLHLTRGILETLLRFRHPVGIVTKSAGVLRDLDILQELARLNLVRVTLSVTTLDALLARSMEPRAATPTRRLAAIAALAQAGVPVGVLAAPMIPGLNDAEMEKILAAASSAGAGHAHWVLLRLPHELREMFTAWLQAHMPDRARHVLSLIRQTRAGKLYDTNWGTRFSGTGSYADLLGQRFDRACRQYGLTAGPKLETALFAIPASAVSPPSAQLQLL